MKTRYVLLFLFSLASLFAATPVSAQSAGEILETTGIQGGLIVHLGCGTGELTTGLAANDRYLVHGLDAEAENVDRARARIRAAGLYGQVSVEQFDGTQLPYSDDLVNLLVAEDLGQVSMDEVLRVLCPRGIAYLKLDGRWVQRTKPWPAEIDEWSHFLHDASNNAVAQDTQVGTPRRLRWVDGPLWSRSHEHNSSLSAMVSAGGRVFYVLDEGLTGVTTESLGDAWTLIARDAFNGVLLWKLPISQWGGRFWGGTALRNIPATIQQRLVAHNDRLFLTLGVDAPVSMLDAATGEILATYEGTEKTGELRCLDGVLLIRQGNNRIVAIDTATGKTLWEATGKIQPSSLAARDGRVLYQDGQTLQCVTLRQGSPLWQTPVKSAVSLLLAHDDCVILLAGRELKAVSIRTGADLWTTDGGVKRRELFIANGLLWQWEGDTIIGRDLASGEVTSRPDTADVFTPGHHLRCYQSKATERYLITPNRGAEFVSLAGSDNYQNDWVRGPCRYGIMPCNGLLYAAPDPCFCYPGLKLTGFNALAPASSTTPQTIQPQDRLAKGPAYGRTPAPLSSLRSPLSDWPTYRHDERRSGATDANVAADVSKRWQVQLSGKLTPPVTADGRVLVVAKQEHTLYALDADDGSQLWQFTAAGPIDSPPTLYGQLVLFGSADGFVYCLNASDGQLVWRFQAAPIDRRIVAFGRLESPWRVHGSVLVKDGVAYCTAGRSSQLDGGIWVFGLDPASGKIVHETRIDTWARTREDAVGKPFIAGYHMEGTNSDILVSQGDYLYLGQYKFDRTLAQQEVPYLMPNPERKTEAMDLSGQSFVGSDIEKADGYESHQRDWLENTQKSLVAELKDTYGGHNLGDRQMGRHVFATGGFLDDSWFNRTFWTYSPTWPGFYIAHRGAKTGQLLVVGPEKTYVIQAFPERNMQSPLFTPGEKGYLLYSDKNDNDPILDDITRGTTKGWGFLRAEPPVWHDWVPVRIRGMVLAGKHLFAAGPPDVVDPADPLASFEGRKGALLQVISPQDGTRLAEYPLDSPPVFDGLIAADGKLYASLVDGSVLCMGSN